MRILLYGFSALFLIAAQMEESALAKTSTPIVIGHRGACGLRPEHTMASYELAIELGADYIEPDLVSTKDGALIARHENEISGTTDVAEKFPDRKTKKVIDGREVEGWFTEDFTLADIKTLRAKERLVFRDHSRDGEQTIPTLQEIITLAKSKTSQTGRVIGIYPETKHPTYFKSIGLPLEAPLLEILKQAGWDKADSPVFIQSFELGNLREMRASTQAPLIFLMDDAGERPYDFVASGDPRTYGDLMKPGELAAMAAFVNGIGPWKRLIVGENPKDKTLAEPGTLVTDAHKAGLLVHPYTFRNEERFLAPDYQGDPMAEYIQFFKLGVDGVFSDFAGTAVQARELFLGR